ncbi:hypothetical protein SLEP1_g7188 [Rubroshorea leprosula]|uniref:Uncharacterized protein n=1 Tax=Rubroshorea leprosula TaxID=152421 RepID=A0AAV5I269_9ROSI|nr:hypothetical protein SLEP1_g7188 [Rubroshorea leprosula]
MSAHKIILGRIPSLRDAQKRTVFENIVLPPAELFVKWVVTSTFAHRHCSIGLDYWRQWRNPTLK